MQKVVIFGIGQIAEVIYAYLDSDDRYDVAGFTVNKEFIKEDIKFDLPIVDFETLENKFSSEEHLIFTAVSFKNLNSDRFNIYNLCKSKGYQFLTYIHPSVTISKFVTIGENTFIFENNVVQPFSSIGNNCIVWSGNHIGHHTKIGDNCFIASHAVISGAVTIGNDCFIGVNATIRDNVSIGEKCILGARSLILKNIKDYTVLAEGTTKKYPIKSIDLKSI